MPQPPTLDQLRKIAERLTGTKGLFIPIGPTLRTSGRYVHGPHFVIAATIYEGQPERAAQVLWDEIQRHDAAQLLTDFSGINLLQSKEQFGGPVHEWLERVCLTDEQRKIALQSDPSGLEHRVQLFHQVGILVAMKAILSCASAAAGDEPRTTWVSIGNTAMAASVFVTGKEYRNGQGTSEDAKPMMEQLASWEVSNSRDLAYSFGRASIQELESLLPHMIRDGLTWPEILSRRFHEDTVWPISVHQAVYEWSKGKQLPPSRNEFLLKAYEDTFNESLALIKDDEPSTNSLGSPAT